MKLVFAGEGGQGVQVIAEILAIAAFLDGKHALYIPNFGVEQRGGVSVAYLVIDTEQVFYPKFEKADISVVMSDRAVSRISCNFCEETKIIAGPSVTAEYPGMTVLPKPDLSPRVWNIYVLGVINRMFSIVTHDNLKKALSARFANQFKAHPELEKLDYDALDHE